VPITVVRAATILDGRGGRISDGAVVVQGDRIVRVLRGTAGRQAARRAAVLYDLGDAAVLPGLIDAHVHITSYINKAGRSHAPLLDSPTDGESEADMVLATADNLHRTLHAGITFVQSMGKPEDVQYREPLKAGWVEGPRLITTLAPIAGPAFPLTSTQLTPDGLRAIVRQRVADGADAIKLFASRSIREGGTTTLNSAQLQALCGEAKARNKRSIVHAHSEESIRLAVLAGCTQIEHGVFATPAVMRLMAERGTYFDPQCGLVFRNYFEHREAFLGIGNFDTAGFAAMERAVPLATNVIRQATATPGLKLIWGTDATAGSHGRNVEDLVCRVREGGQPAMEALVAATSRNAEALGMQNEIGTIAPNYKADIIAVAWDPVQSIEALRNVIFVMLDGRVHRVEPPARVVLRPTSASR
jgi:imidazolonepropionase-like amidohydrolase